MSLKLNDYSVKDIIEILDINIPEDYDDEEQAIKREMIYENVNDYMEKFKNDERGIGEFFEDIRRRFDNYFMNEGMVKELLDNLDENFIEFTNLSSPEDFDNMDNLSDGGKTDDEDNEETNDNSIIPTYVDPNEEQSREYNTVSEFETNAEQENRFDQVTLPKVPSSTPGVQTIGTLKPTNFILNIDSIFREDYFGTTSNNFSFKLPYTLNNVVSIQLSSIEIPNTWYMFSDADGNTDFKMQIYYRTDPSLNYTLAEYNISIPEGNWNNDDLATRLNNYFNDDSNASNFLSFMICTIDDNNSKVMFRIKTVNDFETAQITPNSELSNIIYATNTEELFYYNLVFYEGDLTFGANKYINSSFVNSAGWILGFRQPRYDGIKNTSDYQYRDLNLTYNGVVRGEAVFGVSKFNYVYFSVDDHVANNAKDMIISKKGDTYESQNILGRINIKFGSFFVNVDEGDSTYKRRLYAGPVSIEKLTIKVIDRYGNLLNFNNSDFSLLFEVVQLQ